MASKRKILEHIFTRLSKNTDIIKFVQHEHSLELFVHYPKPKTKDAMCLHCAGNHYVSKDNDVEQTIRHINTRGQ